MEKQGKLIMLAGLLIVCAGLVVWLWGDKLRFLFHLPGDIRYERGNTRFYVPVTTMLIISIVLSALLWLVQKILR